MKIIQLPDVVHDYLVHVLEQHAAHGIHPEEGLALSSLWDLCTKQVTHVDDSAIRKMAAAGSPSGQSTADADREESSRVRAETGGSLP